MIAALARRLPIFYGWVIVAIAFLTMAIAVNARTAFSLFYPPVLAEFGWDRGSTAGAFSFGFLIAAFLGPLLGRIMDRHGPVWTLEGGIITVAAGLWLATIVTVPWQFYGTLGVLVGGGSVALSYTGQALYLPNWFARRRALAISIAYAGAGAGSIVMLPYVQAVIDTDGWRTACRTLAVLVIVVLAPLNLLVRRKPEDIGLTPDGDTAGTAPGRRRVTIMNPEWAAIEWTLARTLRTAPFWWIAFGNFTALYAWYAIQVHQTKYLVDIGFTSTSAAFALGAVSLAGIPGQVAMGWLSDRIGREPVWIAGCTGFVLTYALLIGMSTYPNPAMLWLMVLAQGTLGYGITSVLGPIVAEIYEGRHFGAIYGSVTVGAMAGGAAGPWVTGLLHDHTGSYIPGFLVAGACSIASALAIWIAAPRKIRRVGLV